MTADQLRIESAHGQLLAEYRIRRGTIEVHVPAGNGEVAFSGWRRLSAREFSAHLAENPALAEWLRARAQRSASGGAQEEPSAA